MLCLCYENIAIGKCWPMARKADRKARLQMYALCHRRCI